MTTDSALATFDEEVGGDCPPELYSAQHALGGLAGFDAVTDEHVALFHANGYLVIHNAFSPAEVAGALDGLLDLIAGRHPGYRGVQYEKHARDLIATLPDEQKQDSVRKLWKMVEYESRIAALARHPRLTDLLARLIGDAPELFQDQALLKPPLIGREKPWHQDNAYFNLPPETTVVGVWIALDEATPENGCMFVIPGSHRAGPVIHFKRRDWQICDTDVAADAAWTVPLKPGGCLIFHGLLHHGTPPSRSPQRRRALQFHYKPASVAQIAPEERLAVFGSEGKDVTC
ncbi:MAG TPA: phytanoyl-CoA dioxygenase family protein [Roseiflexaceae bacterium]|nr:phytanoyl-CoA dioxygenase family protein [Roseiflexaceae bacterium]